MEARLARWRSVTRISQRIFRFPGKLAQSFVLLQVQGSKLFQNLFYQITFCQNIDFRASTRWTPGVCSIGSTQRWLKSKSPKLMFSLWGKSWIWKQLVLLLIRVIQLLWLSLLWQSIATGSNLFVLYFILHFIGVVWYRFSKQFLFWWSINIPVTWSKIILYLLACINDCIMANQEQMSWITLEALIFRGVPAKL